MIRLKREMNATSSQDEFAKWAKLRRSHDKVLAQYDEKSKRSRNHERVYAVRVRKTGLIKTPFRSKQPQVLQIDLRPHSHCSALDRHQWPSFLPTVLVLETTSLLDPKGLGAGLCGMAAGIPKSTDWECEYTDMGHCLCDDSAACWSCGGGRATSGKGTRAGKANDEDGCGCRKWEGGGEERTLASGRCCIVYGFLWQLDDIPNSR